MVFQTDNPVAGAAIDIEGAPAEIKIRNTLFTSSSFFTFIGDNFKQAVDLLHQHVVLPVAHNLDQAVALLHQRVVLPVCRICNNVRRSVLEEVAFIHHLVGPPVGRICHNVTQSVFGEEPLVIMPKSTLTFTITALLALTEIKSQGNAGFPFSTHPCAIMVAVTSVIFYGFASAAELIILAQGYDHTSVHVIIARSGRLGCLCILVTSLASLFYF